jgi:hypothetical protein
VAHKIVAKVKIAKQLLASTASSTFTLSSVKNTARPIVRKKIRFVTRKVPQRVWMRKRARLRSLTAGIPTPLIPPLPISPRRSCPIICRQTVSRSQTTYPHRKCQQVIVLHTVRGSMTDVFSLLHFQVSLCHSRIAMGDTFRVRRAQTIDRFR